MNKQFSILVAVAVLALSGCAETTSNSPAVSTAAPAMRSGSQADESACELAVTKQTNNGDVVTLSSDFSQANTEVIVGVGPQRAKWRCLVSGGVVAEVTSMTNEGAL